MTRPLHFGNWRFCSDTRTLTNGTRRAVLEPRVAELLEFLLENPDQLLTHERLISTVWKGRNVSDEAIRRAVSGLRRALAFDGSGRLIETVHKRGYISHLPPTSREDTREEPRRNRDVAANGDGPVFSALAPENQPVPRGRFRRFGLAAILCALIGATALLLVRHLAVAPVEAAGPAEPLTIAVLPFVNLSGDDGSDYFSEGLSEELLRLLGRYDAFRVTARTSSFRFRSPDIPIATIGTELGVQYLLEGSVRRVGQQVRIGASLVDASSGFQLWTESYESDIGHVLNVQTGIAAEVARTLRVVLDRSASEDGAHSPANTEAHLEYLRGLGLMSSWTRDDFDSAVGHFRNATVLDPDYAAAYVQLGEAMLLAANESDQLSALKPAVGFLLDKALTLDPNLGEAYVLRTHSLFAADPQAVEADFRRGLTLNPSYAAGYGKYAEALYFRWNRPDEGRLMIEEALKLDPFEPRYYHLKALMALAEGHYQEAKDLEREALRIDPRFRSGLVQLARLTGTYAGHYVDGLGYAERALAVDPRSEWVRTSLVAQHLNLADVAGARSVSVSPSAGEALLLNIASNNWRDAAEVVRSRPAILMPVSWSEVIDSSILLADAIVTGNAERGAALVAERIHSGEPVSAADLNRVVTRLNGASLDVLAGRGDTALPTITALLGTVESSIQRAPALRVEYLPAVAASQAALGRHDDALASLERAASADGHVAWWWLYLRHPAFDELRNTARFRAILNGARAHAEAERRRLGPVPQLARATLRR